MVILKDTLSNFSALREQRFIRAQKALKKITNILITNYHVKRIILIGSLADKTRFGFHSDIDLCVEGIPNELFFEAVGKLLVEAGEFDIDIIPIENMTSKVEKRIKNGKVLYEKG